MGRLVRALGIAYYYGPHLAMLRMMGPRGALILARAMAWIHWLMTFAGFEKSTRRAIALAMPQLRPGLRVRTVLRRHLELKHQQFVEWYLYITPRGRRYVERTYRTIEGREHLDAARAAGKGGIVLTFHYGMAKLLWPALKHAGYDNHHHVFREAADSDTTYTWAARLAMNTLTRSEEHSGLQIVHHRPFFTFEAMMRLLRKNEIIGMNGDGMADTDFVDFPFLGGTIKLPKGTARMAARSGAPILPAFVHLDGLYRHRVVVYPPIYCAADTPDLTYEAMSRCVALLEENVQRSPWAWWIWRRLDVAEEDGQLRYAVRARPLKEGLYQYAPAPASKAGAAARSPR